MRTNRYQIIVSGRLGMASHEAFQDFHIEPDGTDAALAGALHRSGLRDVPAPHPGPGLAWIWSGLRVWLPS
jgi:hypothetical protein